ncbi:MAG: hypothetical protein ACREB1_02130 [Sphingomicrobium sp.]
MNRALTFIAASLCAALTVSTTCFANEPSKRQLSPYTAGYDGNPGTARLTLQRACTAKRNIASLRSDLAGRPVPQQRYYSIL